MKRQLLIINKCYHNYVVGDVIVGTGRTIICALFKAVQY